MTKKNTRTYLNPSLALTFLIVAVTGVLMLFHLGGGGIRSLHEWMSIVFLIVSAVHLVLNWKFLWACLRRGPVIVSMVVILILSVFLILGGNNREGRHMQGQSGAGHGRYSSLSLGE